MSPCSHAAACRVMDSQDQDVSTLIIVYEGRVTVLYQYDLISRTFCGENRVHPVLARYAYE